MDKKTMKFFIQFKTGELLHWKGVYDYTFIDKKVVTSNHNGENLFTYELSEIEKFGWTS